MGEEVTLFFTEKSPSNNGRVLQKFFNNRFKLPDRFWNDLFESNCPEGLGEINEKLKNDEELSAGDFKSVDESSMRKAEQCKNAAADFKTPILVKSLPNSYVIQSPSLFSPGAQNECQQKGPTSSTPLPSKLVDNSAWASTPKTTRNIEQIDFKTSEDKFLNYSSYNTKTKRSKLSISLVMDPPEQMNLSWSSSLATPPGCLKECSINTTSVIEQGASPVEITDIPVEEPDTIEFQKQSKPKPKGVARILFEKEFKGLKTDVNASNDDFVESTKASETDMDPSSVCRCSGNLSRPENRVPENNTSLSDAFTCSENNVETICDAEFGENPESTNFCDCQSSSEPTDQCQDSLSRSLSECNDLATPAKVHTVAPNGTDSFDMSLLSPLQMKAISELSAFADMPKSSTGVTTVSNWIKSSLEGTLTPQSGAKFDEVNESVNNNIKDFKNLIDMDALSECPFDFSSSLTVPSTPRDDHTSKKVETASQLLQDFKLSQLPDITFNAQNLSQWKLNSMFALAEKDPHQQAKTNRTSCSFTYTQNDKITNGYNVRDIQNETPVDQFVGFSTASGKKLTVSEVSLEKAKKRLMDLDEKNTQEGGRPISSEKENPVDQFGGFSTASGKKLTVSEVSLEKAKKLLVDLDKKNTQKVGRTISLENGPVTSNELEHIKISKECKISEEESLSDEANIGFPKVGGTHCPLKQQLIASERDEQITCRGIKTTGVSCNTAICTYLGMRDEVCSTKLLNNANEIVNGVIQDKNEKIEDADRNVKVATNIDVSTSPKTKFESSRIGSSNQRDNEKKITQSKFLDQKPDTKNNFKCFFYDDGVISSDAVSNNSQNTGVDGKKEKSRPNKREEASIQHCTTFVKHGGILDNVDHSSNAHCSNNNLCETKTSLKPDKENGTSVSSERNRTIPGASITTERTRQEFDEMQLLKISDKSTKCQLDSKPRNHVDAYKKSPEESEVDRNLEHDVVVREIGQSIDGSHVDDSFKLDAVSLDQLKDIRTMELGKKTNISCLEENCSVTSETREIDELLTDIILSQTTGKDDGFCEKSQRILDVLPLHNVSECVSGGESWKFHNTTAEAINEEGQSARKVINEKRDVRAPTFSSTSVSEKDIVSPEESMKKALEYLNEVGGNVNQPQRQDSKGKQNNPLPTFGLPSASGKVFEIHEESLNQARMSLNEEADCRNQTLKQRDENVKQIIPATKVGFTTASRKDAAESLKENQICLTEVGNQSQRQDTNVKQSCVVPKFGFTTASGKDIAISEESLKKAQKFLNEEVAREGHQPHGREVNVGQNTKVPKFAFTTASGKHIAISEESMQKAEKYLNDIKREEHRPKIFEDRGKQNTIAPKFGFITASGKDIGISEESLKEAQKRLSEEKDGEEHRPEKTEAKEKQNSIVPRFAFSCTSGIDPTTSEESWNTGLHKLDSKEHQPDAQAVNETQNTIAPKFGCTTLSEGELAFSKESYKKVEKHLHKEVERYRSYKTEPQGNQKNIVRKLGFTTASGKNVAISEESLRKAQKYLDSVDEEEHQTENAEAHRKQNTVLPKFGFTTASGRDIKISDESLKKARKYLEDIPGKEHHLVASDLKFSSASGKDDVIPIKPLQEARRRLDKEDEGGHQSKSETANTQQNISFSDWSKKERSTDPDPGNCRFPGASGEEIALAEGQMFLRTGNDEGRQAIVEQHELDLTKNNKEVENVSNNEKDDEHRACAKSGAGLSSTSQQDIRKVDQSSSLPDSSLCDKTISTQWKQISNCENDGDFEMRRKRLSSETEAENGRHCKASRIEKEAKTDVRRCQMKPKRSDPLAEYSDRKYSKFQSPLRAVMVSPNLEYTDQLASSRNQLVDIQFKQIPTTPNSTTKPSSHFITPYRATVANAKQEHSKLSEKMSGSSDKSKPEEKGKKSAKEHSVKPRPGSIYKLRNSACFKRISFADYVCSKSKRWTSDELVSFGIPVSVLSITCENAGLYRFKGSNFLSEAACATNCGVRFTDGAVLFLGEDKCAGVEEFSQAFLSSPGVDPKLISREWVANHYKWIVWKLASYEVSYPQLFCGRSLTPDMVLRQLKYRYDREIDNCERSAIKKILERDDSSCRSMVLCVASVNAAGSREGSDSECNHKSKNVQKQQVILMTDGWYSIRVQLDEYLQNLVREKKLYIGQKLFVQGAELIGSEQAVSPLEAPSSLHLRIHGNSTRPAKKFSRLGFHCKNHIFTVPIPSVSSSGGLVSSIDVFVARQYPLQFMENLPGGSRIFRNPRCEERVAKKFDQEVERKREEVMMRVQNEVDNEDSKNTSRKTKRNCLSLNQIENLCDGKELFDVVNNATDPFKVENCLSVEQRRALDNFKENLHNDRAAIVRRKFEEAWRKLAEEEALKRDVVPVLKVKLVDRFPSKTNKSPATALLTLWRPTEQTITTLAEGKCLTIYNLHASRYNKGNTTVQLCAKRNTIYKTVPSDAAFQNTFEARKVYTFCEISDGLRLNVEVDVVAIVVSQTSLPNLTLVYLADSDLNFVRVRIWGGLENQGLEDIMKKRNFIAACNLLSQPDRRFGIPSLKYSELSLVTSNPSNKKLRRSLAALRKQVLWNSRRKDNGHKDKLNSAEVR